MATTQTTETQNTTTYIPAVWVHVTMLNDEVGTITSSDKRFNGTVVLDGTDWAIYTDGARYAGGTFLVSALNRLARQFGDVRANLNFKPAH